VLIDSTWISTAGGSRTQRLLRFSNGRPLILFAVHMLDYQTHV
jgi:hypothetical protein